MIARRLAVVACVGILALSLGAAEDGDQESAGSDLKTCGYGTYCATKDRVSVVASTYIASFEKSEKHFALHVAVGVAGKGPEYKFTRDSFWLVDAQGVSHAISPLEELSGEVALLDFTDKMEDRFPLQLPHNFEFLTRVRSDFYALDDLRWTDVNLSQDSFFEDVIFFQHPAGGFDGVFTLQVAGEGMPDAVEVKLSGPLDKKKYKKENKKHHKEKTQKEEEAKEAS
jgi:hypothetical protein